MHFAKILIIDLFTRRETKIPKLDFGDSSSIKFNNFNKLWNKFSGKVKAILHLLMISCYLLHSDITLNLHVLVYTNQEREKYGTHLF